MSREATCGSAARPPSLPMRAQRAASTVVPLVKYWSNTGQPMVNHRSQPAASTVIPLVKYWSNNGQIMVNHRSRAGSTVDPPTRPLMHSSELTHPLLPIPPPPPRPTPSLPARTLSYMILDMIMSMIS